MNRFSPPGKEMWNERFSSEEYVYGKEPNQFLKNSFERDSSLFQNPVLVLGDGEGRNGVYLASNGLEATSLDFSEKALEKAKLLAGEKKAILKTILNDINKYKFQKDHWGTIVSIFFHIDPKSRRQLHRNIKKSLVKNGLVILEAYSPRQLQFESGGPKDRDMLYTVEELKNDFVNFDIIQLEEVETVLNEGCLHQGRASVVRFIGRKI